MSFLTLLRAAPRRAFSTTRSLGRATGDLPSFEATSNPALDTLLARIRDELFIPSHLLVRHKQLIYRPKNHKILQEEPVEIEIQGQTVPLTPKLHETTIPLKAFTQALKLMETRSDLDAIPGLISGFAQVKRQFRPRQFELLARTLATQNRTDLLLNIAQNAAQEYGFKFTAATGRDFMRGFWVRAQHPKKTEAFKALMQAQQVHTLMVQDVRKLVKEEKLTADPVLWAILLDIKAQACIRFNDGADYVTKNKKGAELGERSVVQWTTEQLWEAMEVLGRDMPEMVLDKKHMPQIKAAYLDWWFVARGMKNALEVLKGDDSRVAKWLPKKLIEVEMMVDKWKAFMEANEAYRGKTPELFLQAVEEMKKEVETERAERAEEVEEVEEVEEKS